MQQEDFVVDLDKAQVKARVGVYQADGELFGVIPEVTDEGKTQDLEPVKIEVALDLAPAPKDCIHARLSRLQKAGIAQAGVLGQDQDWFRHKYSPISQRHQWEERKDHLGPEEIERGNESLSGGEVKGKAVPCNQVRVVPELNAKEDGRLDPDIQFAIG